MKRSIFLILSLIIAASLAACGDQSVPAQDTLSPDSATSIKSSDGSISCSWHEIGEGPAGWVIGVRFDNDTDVVFTQDVKVTVTDEDGDLLAEDVFTVEVQPKGWESYPIHCAKADGYHVEVDNVDCEENTASVSSSSVATAPAVLPTFGVSYKGLLDVLRVSHTGFDDEPEMHVMQAADGITLNQYVYTADNFISVQFYETETDELQSVIVMAKYSDMTTDQAKTLGSFFALITGSFEPDASVLEEIDAKLDIPNTGFASGTCNSASGTLADFEYIVDNSNAMVTITAI